jgi:transcriptional regulator with XRE-family HTH domain
MHARAIRTLRRRYGWTQADLAARIGTDAVTVSRWERGVSRPRRSAQIRLQELATPLPADVSSLVRLIGDADAERLLQRAVLLAHRTPHRRFAVDPTERLREVERARGEQMALKARARVHL